MKSRERGHQLLGMPMGTANARLRKMILFNLSKKCGMDICIRCNNPIERIEDFTIEHIQPWEHRNSKLFWDLSNIAFSHSKCNVPYYRWNKKYSVEEAKEARKKRNRNYMKKVYSTEKRREKMKREKLKGASL